MDKQILITGSSRGIGRETALYLAQNGYDIVLHYNRTVPVDVQKEIEELGRKVRTLKFDVSNRAECSDVLLKDIGEHGMYYGIVVNAGISRDNVFPAMEDSEWDDVLNTNLGGFYNVLRPLVMPMIEKRIKGRIVTLSSISGLCGNRGQVNYSASKAGIIGATKALSLELAKRGITVNCVAPGVIDTDMTKDLPVDEMKKMIDIADVKLNLDKKPAVILVVGVNGVGKTTSIGKIANRLKKDGNKVVIAAADTFRAAATEQIEIWANRASCELVKRDEGSDPASVVYDAIKRVKEENADVLICDTAGRLHNKKNLMDELAKIQKVIDKELPDSSKEVLLVIDGTTGQNAISQVKAFKEVTHITGLVLTKLDGTAKGGVVVGIISENQIPVKFIGVGEQIDDMEVFNSDDFLKAII